MGRGNMCSRVCGTHRTTDARVLRKNYIRPSIWGRQVFYLAEQRDQSGRGAYWRHAAPPMALYDPVLCENSADGLRGLAVIELEHAAEPLTAPDWAQSE
jgi:hypothetical protein